MCIFIRSDNIKFCLFVNINLKVNESVYKLIRVKNISDKDLLLLMFDLFFQ